MNASHIKIFAMDVDGTLTDGKIYIGSEGEVMKAFDVKDGYAIAHMLPELGIKPVVITGRNSTILERRCSELGISKLYQGVQDKQTCLQSILSKESLTGNEVLSFANVAYIGDDLPDLDCMSAIQREGGLAGCPHDAVREVLNLADFVAPHAGGNGAVRDFIEWLRAWVKSPEVDDG